MKTEGLTHGWITNLPILLVIAFFCFLSVGLASADSYTYILSGGPSSETSLVVDDDLEVKVNGKTVFVDDDGVSTLYGGASWYGAPITFSASPGDTLRIIATNPGGVDIELSPLHLHVNGQSLRLSDGVQKTPSEVYEFFNRSFTISIPPPLVSILDYSPSPVHGEEDLNVKVSWKNIPAGWKLVVSLEESEGNITRLADDVSKMVSGSGEETFKLKVYPTTETRGEAKVCACIYNEKGEWTGVFEKKNITVATTTAPITERTPFVFIFALSVFVGLSLVSYIIMRSDNYLRKEINYYKELIRDKRLKIIFITTLRLILAVVFFALFHSYLFEQYPKSGDPAKLVISSVFLFLAMSCFILSMGIIRAKPYRNLNSTDFIVSFLMGAFLLFVAFAPGEKEPPPLFLAIIPFISVLLGVLHERDLKMYVDVIKHTKQLEETAKRRREEGGIPIKVKEISLSIERTIYDPCKRDFIERPLPRMKEWVNHYDPGAYWFATSIQNNTDKTIEEWGVELETSSALKVGKAIIEGIEYKIELRESHPEPFKSKYIIGVPKEYGIVIPKGGAQRVYFKLCAEKPKTVYEISGIFKSIIGEVPIRPKEFKYLCDAGMSPEAIKAELKKTFSEKDAARLASAFRIVQDIRNIYCDTNTKAKDINKEFDLLKMYLTEKEFLVEIEGIQRKIIAELREDERLDDKHVEEVKDFCEKFTEMWIARFLR